MSSTFTRLPRGHGGRASLLGRSNRSGRLRAAAALIAATALVAATTPAHASFREDAAFGVGGRVLTDFPGGGRGASAVVAEPGGGLVVGGETNGGDFALYRLAADGTHDPVFGTAGFATTDFDGDRDIVSDLALQADGKIVAVGDARQGGEPGFGLARYLPDGSPDLAFGIGGIVFTDPTAGRFIGEGANAVALQSDGKIVAAGGSAEDFAVARYLADGTPDPSFGTSGVARLDLGGFDAATGIIVQTDGAIVVGGQGASDFALVRYLPDGSLDPSFGAGGIVRTDLSGEVDSPRALARQPDGRLVLAGSADGDLAVARYLPDGSPDPTFGTGGRFLPAGLDRATSLALMPDGRLLAGGVIRGGITEFCMLILEIQPAGELGDFSGACFGEETSASPFDLAVLSDGSVIAAGSVDSFLPGADAARAAVVRFKPNARPVADAGGPYEVGEGGRITVDATGSSDADGDPLIYQWDLDNDGTFETETATASIDAPRDDATFEVCMRVSDGVIPDGECTTVAVRNVAPDVTLDPEQVIEIDEGEVVSVAGSFSDPGSLDTYSGSIEWGDPDLGSTPASITLSSDGPPGDDRGRADATSRYGDDGSFTVAAEVRDDDGGRGSDDRILTVRNVAPSAAIDLPGATITGGGPALIAGAGEEVSLEGRSTDPGSDDLTLVWDLDDGTAPVSLFSPVDPALEDPPNALDPTASPTVAPRDVTDSRTHAFGGSCLYEVTLTSRDDDGGEGHASAAVLITGPASTRWSAGWWQSQLAGAGHPPLSAETLDCYIGIARFASTIFGEAVALGGRDDAAAVLQPSGESPSHLRLFDRQLLAAYLNFANGAVGFDQVVVDADGDRVSDTSFGDAVADAESVRLDPSSTQAEVDRQRSLLTQINRAAG